jgi:hypothetical protein
MSKRSPKFQFQKTSPARPAPKAPEKAPPAKPKAVDTPDPVETPDEMSEDDAALLDAIWDQLSEAE